MIGANSYYTGRNTSPFYFSIGTTLAFAVLSAWYANRLRRSRWLGDEKDPDAMHSVINQFSALILDPETSVEEANKRRTTSYYLKMRESHFNSLVPGIYPHSKLLQLRHAEFNKLMSYWHKRNKSHRTIVVMCDDKTQTVLEGARKLILEPLNYSHDVETSGVWIPKENMIPGEDMHVTIALPWWWHTIRPGNNELTRKMAQRFKQTLLLEFHYPFEIELERIILLGGKTLVALWRCVGERTNEHGRVIHDRHGESADPMVRLREEIVRCFITESPDQRRRPLTYQDEIAWGGKEERDHTISRKTPGMSGVGTADGFIHTTLCRLPLECLSSHDVELERVHRLCREASATLSGHRMVIDKYRFLETMGEGGESNPCYKPLYDETICAPIRHEVSIEGTVMEQSNGTGVGTAEGVASRTIGKADNFLLTEVIKSSVEEDTTEKKVLNTLSDLFLPPE